MLGINRLERVLEGHTVMVINWVVLVDSSDLFAVHLGEGSEFFRHVSGVKRGYVPRKYAQIRVQH